jgi:hypothetical protein
LTLSKQCCNIITLKPTKRNAMETEIRHPMEIIKALNQVMAKVGYVQKKDKNDFHKYTYASEGALLEVLRPAMIEAGLVLIPSGKSISEIDTHGITHIELEYTLAHISGAVWPDKIVAYGEGGDKNKNGVGDKGAYKAITGANKYLLFKLFQIETGDDPEADGKRDLKDKGADKGKGKPAPRAEKQAPKRMASDFISEDQVVRFHTIKKAYGWTDSAAKSLLAKYSLTSTKDIPAWGKYTDIIEELKKGMDGKGKPTPPEEKAPE